VDATRHVLIVDDDTRLRALLRRYLGGNGYRVSEAADAAQAEQQLAAIEYDLMILDVMLPGENGTEFARRMRQQGSAMPILMLTALGDPGDRIAGLESGVDDYLAKPFEPKELLLRIQAILRRGGARPSSTAVRFGPFRFDRATNRLTHDDTVVHLTTGEAALLHVLASNAGGTVSRDKLAGEDGDPSGRSVDVQVTRLRRKLEADPRQPLHLQTVRGEGYVLWADVEPDA